MAYEIVKGVELPQIKVGLINPALAVAEKLKPDEGFYAPKGERTLAQWRQFASRLNNRFPGRTYRAAQIKDRIFIKRIK